MHQRTKLEDIIQFLLLALDGRWNNWPPPTQKGATYHRQRAGSGSDMLMLSPLRQPLPLPQLVKRELSEALILQMHYNTSAVEIHRSQVQHKVPILFSLLYIGIKIIITT